MSKLGCICGNVITDQTNDIPYKATFVRDQDSDNYFKWTDDVASFIEAIVNGQRDEWIKQYFTNEYPTNIDNSSIVFDIMRQNRDFESTIYQCENCGRVKFQVQNTNIYTSFKPEDDRYKDIFKRFQ